MHYVHHTPEKQIPAYAPLKHYGIYSIPRSFALEPWIPTMKCMYNDRKSWNSASPVEDSTDMSSEGRALSSMHFLVRMCCPARSFLSPKSQPSYNMESSEG